MKKAPEERQLSLPLEETPSAPSLTSSSLQKMLGGVALSKIVEPVFLRGDRQQPAQEDE